MVAFSHPLWRFLCLYGALYAGFGVLSPYLPTLLESRNLGPEAIALVLGAGTAIRLIAGPVAGRLADILDAPKAVLAACSVAAALIALGYLQGTGLLLLFVVGVLQSAALAPLAPLTDTLALASAAPHPSEDSAQQRFHYGWLRGGGSAAFICGTLLSGQAIAQFGITAAVWLSAGLLTATAFAARLVPVLTLAIKNAARPVAADGAVRGFAALLRLPSYRRIIFVAALILGSHAMHDSFAVIRWEAAGIGPNTIGALWSMSVAAEVVVFLFIGRPLLDRIGPGSCRNDRRRGRCPTLGDNGRDYVASGSCRGPATTRAYIRAVAPDLHAASRAMRASSPGSNRIDGLRNRWHRLTNGTLDNRLRPTL